MHGRSRLANRAQPHKQALTAFKKCVEALNDLPSSAEALRVIGAHIPVEAQLSKKGSAPKEGSADARALKAGKAGSTSQAGADSIQKMFEALYALPSGTEALKAGKSGLAFTGRR